MTYRCAFVLVTMLFAASTPVVIAHHAFSPVYDEARTVTIKGVSHRVQADKPACDDQLTVTGNPTHTGSPRIFFTRMVLPNGKEMIGPGAGDVGAIEEQRRQRARQRSQQK